VFLFYPNNEEKAEKIEKLTTLLSFMGSKITRQTTIAEIGKTSKQIQRITT
jgi:hypothetical protein